MEDKDDPPMTPQQIREMFKEWTQDYAARKQINEGKAQDDRPREQQRDRGR
jgi:hypothetical protein